MFLQVLKGNPYHDQLGKFTGPGGVVQSVARTTIPISQEDAETTISALTGISQAFVADHPMAFKTAVVVADTIREMRDKGYKLPASVMIQMVEQKDPSGEVETRSGEFIQTSAALRIKLPKTIPSDIPLDTVVAKAFGGQTTEGGPIDLFAVHTMKDIVVHEMGHIQAGSEHTFHEARGARGPFATRVDSFQNLNADEVIRNAAYTVSDYAYSSASEFMAEAFTRLYRGEVLSPDARLMYDAMKGPKIL